MKVAIISDIHGNLDAFRQVLNDIEASGINAVVCLGDNVGSVGQPRDDNNNAKYVIWNTLEDSLEVRFVPYDIAAVVSKIIATGLPQVHADRLW